MPERNNTHGAVSVPPGKRTDMPEVLAESSNTTVRHYTQRPQYCDECGGRLIRIGYCFTCVACGWGGCS